MFLFTSFTATGFANLTNEQ